MRQNYAADWAFGICGALEATVRRHFPDKVRLWPLLQTFNYEAYNLADQFACIILEDKLSGIPCGPGDLKPYPFNDHPPLPVRPDNLELWQYYLRSKFNLKIEDAAFIIPLYDSGKNPQEDFGLFTSEEKFIWDRQMN